MALTNLAVAEEALSLSPAERADLAKLLIQSLQNDRQKYQEILQSIAELYCQGYELNWIQLYNHQKIRRIGLPTYPFAPERYWRHLRKTNDE